MTKKRECRTCKKRKGPKAYANSAARTCNVCRNTPRVCTVCGTEFTPAWEKREYTRKTCSDECYQKVQRGNLQIPKRKPLPKTRVCSQCKKRKPLDHKHFYRRKGYNFQHICRTCSKALQRDRYYNVPGEREKAGARARRHKERLDARRKADPVFDAEYRRKKEEANRRYWERRKLGGAEVIDLPESWSGPELPAAPLLDRIKAYAKRNGLSEEDVAEHIGTSARRLNAWKNAGNKALVRESLADRILLNLGLNWFEVWDPAEYPDVAERLAA